MGKKVDLNQKRNTELNNKKHNTTNHKRAGQNKNSIFGRNQSKGTSSMNNNSYENNRGESASTINSGAELVQSVGKFLMKLPMPIKMILLLVVAIVSVGILIAFVFVTIFSSDDESGSSSSAYGSAAQNKCSTVTVTDTQNNIYDGEITYEEYIAGVVAAEVELANNIEYYKTAAIAARTYFLKNSSNTCSVKGNATFQAYKDVEDSAYKDMIKQAVEETTGVVMMKNDNLANSYYASACVVNADDNYYYVRYGSKTLDETKLQQIPKSWDSESAFQGYLGDWYSYVDKSNTDYYNKDCPNNHDYGMSQLGALYLITNENYSYKDVIKYYYGDVSLANSNSSNTSQVVNGFINPVNNLGCSNGYGCRLHPIYNTYRLHSGVDINASSGEPILATKNGTVTEIQKGVPGYSETYGYGNYITIDHGDGTKTRYAHMLYGSIPDSIEIGTEVIQGQVIGQVGSTGTSTGPHLHYEIYQNGETINPYNSLDLTNVENAAACNSNADVPMSYCGR